MRFKSWKRLISESGSLEEGLALIGRENLGGSVLLPDPPTDEETVMYSDSGRRLIVSAGLASAVPLSAGLYLFCSVEPFYGPLAAVTVGYLLLSYLIAVSGKDVDVEDHDRIVSAFVDYSPSVDVFLPCCGEAVEILENTYSHVSRLRWFSRKLKVYVLDDGPRPESVAALAREFDFEYLRRPDVGVMKKAGNLRHAFSVTRGEYFVIFDADFCPRPDFLERTIPHFAARPDVAIVQTPQFFRYRREQTWVERAAGSQQELFYRLVQQNRQAHHATICVGSCAAYRRSSLEPFGGTACVSASEDVHTSFAVTDAGWKVRYLPFPLATGTCPDERKAYWTQSYRWCLGSVALTTSREFWTSRLTVAQKACYASGGLYYAATAASIVLNATPGILLVLLRPGLVLWYNALFAVPSLVLSFAIMRVWNEQHYGLECVRIRWIQYSAHLSAIVDSALGDGMAWVPTGARAGRNAKFNSAMSFLLHVVVAQVVLLYAGSAYRVAQGYPFWNFVPGVAIETLNALMCFQAFYK